MVERDFSRERRNNKKRKPSITRVTDLEEVKKLFTRPKLIEGGGIKYIGDEEFFEEVQKRIAESGAILKGHFIIEED
jgi:hypothetical protein